jgi:hypothetical protein
MPHQQRPAESLELFLCILKVVLGFYIITIKSEEDSPELYTLLMRVTNKVTQFSLRVFASSVSTVKYC